MTRSLPPGLSCIPGASGGSPEDRHGGRPPLQESLQPDRAPLSGAALSLTGAFIAVLQLEVEHEGGPHTTSLRGQRVSGYD